MGEKGLQDPHSSARHNSPRAASEGASLWLDSIKVYIPEDCLPHIKRAGGSQIFPGLPHSAWEVRCEAGKKLALDTRRGRFAARGGRRRRPGAVMAFGTPFQLLSACFGGVKALSQKIIFCHSRKVGPIPSSISAALSNSTSPRGPGSGSCPFLFSKRTRQLRPRCAEIGS